MTEIGVAYEPPLARLTLNRPERRNAMSAAMWRRLPELCAEIEARADVAVVVMAGAGGHFCAGADIAEFDHIFAEPEIAATYLASIESALEALSVLDRPVIAALEGSAIGGGLALALACDLRFAAEDAHLAVPPAKLGLLYGPAETRLLVETVGPAAAKDMLFSARRMETEEALRLGLINRRLPADTLSAAVEAQARDWSALSQTSIRGAKKAVRAALAGDAGRLRELTLAAAMGGDFREGRAAFQARRPPQFGSTI